MSELAWARPMIEKSGIFFQRHPWRGQIAHDYSRSESDSGEESQQQNEIDCASQSLRVIILKKTLISFISSILAQRGRHDFVGSIIQVSNEHRKYRVFRKWKESSLMSLQRKAEAEFKFQQHSFHFCRKIFKEWQGLVKKDKKASLNLLRKWFDRLKAVCFSDLLLRVKRIQLIAKRKACFLSIFFLRLHQNQSAWQEQEMRAINHHNTSLCAKLFSTFRKGKEHLRRDKMRFQQYKMAFLAHKNTILRKYFGWWSGRRVREGSSIKILQK